MIDGAEFVRSRLPIADGVADDMELRAVAIAPRLGCDDVDLTRRLDFPEPTQFFYQDVALDFELPFVGRVLVVAPAAACEIGAARGDAIGRGFEHGCRAGAQQAGLFLTGLGADAFTGQHERRKNYAAIQTREAITPVNQFFNIQFDYDRIYPLSLP